MPDRGSSSASRLNRSGGQCAGPTSNSQAYRRHVQTLVTTALIVGSFVIAWCPSILLYALVCFNCAFTSQALGERLVVALAVVKTALVLTKLLLNPLIYSWRFHHHLR